MVDFLSLLALRVPRDEQITAETFGVPYREYARNTGRFWPEFPLSWIIFIAKTCGFFCYNT